MRHGADPLQQELAGASLQREIISARLRGARRGSVNNAGHLRKVSWPPSEQSGRLEPCERWREPSRANQSPSRLIRAAEDDDDADPAMGSRPWTRSISAAGRSKASEQAISAAANKRRERASRKLLLDAAAAQEAGSKKQETIRRINIGRRCT